MELKCNFLQVLETKQGTGKNGNAWESSTILCEVGGQYPKKPIFEVFNNQDLFAGLQSGAEVTVHFDIDSTEWNGKRFAKIRAFKIDRQQQPAQTHTPAEVYQAKPIEPATGDLPF